MPDATTLDDILLALASPVRRRMFEILFAGEARVADIGTAVSMTGADLDQHIVLLETAGLVTRLRRRDGDALTGHPAPLNEAAGWINTNRELWAMRIQLPDRRLASLGQDESPNRPSVHERRVDRKPRRARPSGPRGNN
ncbi:transcriptional regulator [Ensifer sp.]|uniref:transcriptional regulator n=1 Tax=Ensifer sp. TaxID=1872086 RepID=UPI002E11E4C5|nr:transcriptional regulator [Ensifer sp.]